jgi:hypothetical protein
VITAYGVAKEIRDAEPIARRGFGRTTKIGAPKNSRAHSDARMKRTARTLADNERFDSWHSWNFSPEILFPNHACPHRLHIDNIDVVEKPEVGAYVLK